MLSILDIVLCKAYLTYVKNRVKENRLRKELTQEGLADLCGVSRQTIISIESERYEPSTSLALKISRILKLRVEDLFIL